MHSEVANLLLEAGLLDEDGLQAVLGAVIQHGGTFVQQVVALGMIDGEKLADFLSERTGIRRLNSSQLENLPDFLTRIVDTDLAVAYRLVPVLLEKGCLHLAMSDPTDRVALESVAFSSGYKTKPVVASDTAIEKALARYYGASSPSRATAGSQAPAKQESSPTQEQSRTHHDEKKADNGVFNKLPPGMAGPETGEAPESSHSETADQRKAAPGAPRGPAGGETGPLAEGPTSDKSFTEEIFRENHVDQVVTLTRVKRASDESAAESIGEAIARHAEAIDPDQIVVLEPSRIKRKKEQPQPRQQAHEQSPATAGRDEPGEVGQTRLQSPAGDNDAKVVQRIEDLHAVVTEAERGEESQPLREVAGAEKTKPAEQQREKAAGEQDPLHKLRQSLANARHRDDIARALIEFGRQYAKRVLLLIVRKDVAVGWMGRGDGIEPAMVKGIIIPLHSPSIFKEVVENQADYYGPIPHTVVNDVFLSALGGIRPARALVIPISVQYKPVAILYADSGAAPDFDGDLAPLHLVLEDVSRAFEKLIIEKKKSRTRR